MAKKNFKEFVKEHKKEIETAANIVGVCAGAWLIYDCVTKGPWYCGWRFKTKKERDAAFDAITTVHTAWNNMGIGTGAAMWNTADAAALSEKLVDGIFTDANGDALKITGAILFGNKVET